MSIFGRQFNIIFAKLEQIECSLEKLLNRIPVNIGTGVGLFKRLFNNKFEFKSLVAGNNVTITSTNEEIIINSSAICDEPLFTASVAYGITASDVNHWNTAYAWGNHAAAGYLTSYTETDPIYTSSSWYTTTNNSSNWNTAYGWGNHALAGYLTSLPAHNHDDRYYTKIEVDTLISGIGGGTEIITRVLTANVTNSSSTPAEIIGLSFEADPNSTYIITGGLNIMFGGGTSCHAGMTIPSGTFNCTFYWKKNSSNDVAMTLADGTNSPVIISQSNKEGHVGVYAVVTTGATGGTVKFRHVNYGTGGIVSTKAKSFIKAVKHS